MKDTVSNSKLALRSRCIEHFEHPAKLSEWVSGSEREFFYIICPERSTIRHKRRYLCVFKSSADGREESADYVTGCKPRKNRDKPDTYMLFSLIKPRKATSHLETLGIEDQSDLTTSKGKISNEKGSTSIYFAMAAGLLIKGFKYIETVYSYKARPISVYH